MAPGLDSQVGGGRGEGGVLIEELASERRRVAWLGFALIFPCYLHVSGAVYNIFPHILPSAAISGKYEG